MDGDIMKTMPFCLALGKGDMVLKEWVRLAGKSYTNISYLCARAIEYHEQKGGYLCIGKLASVPMNEKQVRTSIYLSGSQAEEYIKQWTQSGEKGKVLTYVKGILTRSIVVDGTNYIPQRYDELVDIKYAKDIIPQAYMPMQEEPKQVVVPPHPDETENNRAEEKIPKDQIKTVVTETSKETPKAHKTKGESFMDSMISMFGE